MEFIDYAYYKEVYCGSLTEEGFKKVYHKALAYLIGATRNRIKTCDTPVSFALCELCDIFAEDISCDKIKTESCDGYSVTYRETMNTYSLAWDVLITYLESSGYLYGGNDL